MKKTRCLWIDCVKAFACILVALGHLLQSFVDAGIMPESQLHLVFDQSIYTFHVPLFFICSGYLYQRFSIVDSIDSWKEHVIKKLWTLGIPYVVFVTLTWGIKRFLSNSVNTPVGGLFDSLVVHPIMQYWYLYCLFLLFLIIPTAKSKEYSLLFLIIAVSMKFISFVFQSDFFALSTLLNNAVWLVLGICMCTFNVPELFRKRSLLIPAAGCLLAFALCCVIKSDHWTAAINFVAGLLACTGITLFFGCCCENNRQMDWIQSISKYTMPVYLMHTMFAAAGRIILLKTGINGFMIHMVTGLLLSFAAPVVATEIILRTKWFAWTLGVRTK